MINLQNNIFTTFVFLAFALCANAQNNSDLVDMGIRADNGDYIFWSSGDLLQCPDGSFKIAEEKSLGTSFVTSDLRRISNKTISTLGDGFRLPTYKEMSRLFVNSTTNVETIKFTPAGLNENGIPYWIIGIWDAGKIEDGVQTYFTINSFGNGVFHSDFSFGSMENWKFPVKVNMISSDRLQLTYENGKKTEYEYDSDFDAFRRPGTNIFFRRRGKPYYIEIPAMVLKSNLSGNKLYFLSEELNSYLKGDNNNGVRLLVTDVTNTNYHYSLDLTNQNDRARNIRNELKYQVRPIKYIKGTGASIANAEIQRTKDIDSLRNCFNNISISNDELLDYLVSLRETINSGKWCNKYYSKATEKGSVCRMSVTANGLEELFAEFWNDIKHMSKKHKRENKNSSFETVTFVDMKGKKYAVNTVSSKQVHVMMSLISRDMYKVLLPKTIKSQSQYEWDLFNGPLMEYEYLQSKDLVKSNRESLSSYKRGLLISDEQIENYKKEYQKPNHSWKYSQNYKEMAKYVKDEILTEKAEQMWAELDALKKEIKSRYGKTPVVHISSRNNYTGGFENIVDFSGQCSLPTTRGLCICVDEELYDIPFLAQKIKNDVIIYSFDLHIVGSHRIDLSNYSIDGITPTNNMMASPYTNQTSSTIIPQRAYRPVYSTPQTSQPRRNSVSPGTRTTRSGQQRQQGHNGFSTFRQRTQSPIKRR